MHDILDALQDCIHATRPHGEFGEAASDVGVAAEIQHSLIVMAIDPKRRSLPAQESVAIGGGGADMDGRAACGQAPTA